MRSIVASATILIACLPACGSLPVESAPVSAQAAQVVEACAVFSPGMKDFVDLPSLRVGRLDADEDFALPQGAPKDASFVQCERADLMPLPSDYKVIAAGYPLVIASGGRVATLEISEGRVNFRTLTGRFTDKEIPVIRDYMNRAAQLLSDVGDEA